MSANVIRIPLTCCPACRSAYHLGEWRELAGVAPPDDADPRLDWRRCWCGQTLALDIEGIEALDVVVPEEMYRQLFPHSTRRAEKTTRPKLVASALRWLADRLG